MKLLLLTNNSNYTSDTSSPFLLPTIGLEVEVSPQVITPIEDIKINQKNIEFKIDDLSIPYSFFDFGMNNKDEFESRYKQILSKDELFVMECDMNFCFV